MTKAGKPGGLKAAIKNTSAICGAVLLMTFISIVLGNLLVYPIVLHHTKIIQVAGPFMIIIFVIFIIRSLWLYKNKQKIKFQNDPDLKEKMFLPYFLRAILLRYLKNSIILFFITMLFLLMSTLVLINTKMMFH